MGTGIFNILAVLFFFVSEISCQEILHIGLLPGWRPVTHAAWRTISTTQVYLFDVDTGKTGNAYDKMNSTHRSLLERRDEDKPTHAVIGPYDPWVSLALNDLEIPYLCVTPMHDLDGSGQPFQVQLVPEMEQVAGLFVEMASAYDWTKVSVFYDDDKGFDVLQQLMEDHNRTIRAWHLQDHMTRKEVREALIEMRKTLVEKCIVICDKQKTDLLLDEARNLAMLSTPPYSWMFYDPGDEFQKILRKYNDININFTLATLLPFNHSMDFGRQFNRLDFAVALDALNLVVSAAGVAKKEISLQKNLTMTKELFRKELNRAIRGSDIQGHTGNVQFNQRGKRSNFTLKLTALNGDTTFPRGIWRSLSDSPNHIDFFPIPKLKNITSKFPLKGRKAKIVMIEEQPFTMRKRDYMLKRGNARFEGFAVDLIAAVAEMLGFEYEIYLVHDGKFGSKDDSGEWNGLVGELLSGNATMSVAPLTINAEREEVVDFTKPFKTRYISVVMRIPKKDRSYFEFLNPLSLPVWVCTICAFVVVSVVLYALERVGRKKNGSDDNIEISIRESFWFIFGSLLQGNTDSSPSTIPGRILTSAWWFFALILISSYTANLAAFLTVKKINTPIKSVTDLSQQTKIKYGTVKDSGVMAFFKNTKIEHFNKMWLQMSELSSDSMVDNTTQGYDNVKNGDYAFFWDTTVNKYRSNVDCDIMEIGPPFDPKGFGIGVPPGATYRDELSISILKLGDHGILHELETKWWDAKECPDLSKAAGEEASELQIENVAGVFFILVGGIVIAAVVCLGEYFGNAMIKASKNAVGRRGQYKTREKNGQKNHSPMERDAFL